MNAVKMTDYAMMNLTAFEKYKKDALNEIENVSTIAKVTRDKSIKIVVEDTVRRLNDLSSRIDVILKETRLLIDIDIKMAIKHQHEQNLSLLPTIVSISEDIDFIKDYFRLWLLDAVEA